ncbi:hypothetical protein M8J77_023921 [Diaphorina citri]|nr:hypothetical protein M8J77_023921 [Diaphorina citri]
MSVSHEDAYKIGETRVGVEKHKYLVSNNNKNASIKYSTEKKRSKKWREKVFETVRQEETQVEEVKEKEEEEEAEEEEEEEEEEEKEGEEEGEEEEEEEEKRKKGEGLQSPEQLTTGDSTQNAPVTISPRLTEWW